MNGTAGCQLFLDLLPSTTTVADLLYGKFHVVLNDLAKNARKQPDKKALAEGLERFAVYLEGVDNGNTPAWHFYAYDPDNPPNSNWPANKWKVAYGDQVGAAQKKIVDHFRFPFLDLGANSTHPEKMGKREIIAKFVKEEDPWDSTKRYVESRIGAIKYCDIFKKTRNHPDVCGPMSRTPDKHDPAWTKFRLIRRAFHHGIFADMSAMAGTHTMDQTVMIPQPNGECYSESAQECIPMHNGYCWTLAGSPGAGSTFCE